MLLSRAPAHRTPVSPAPFHEDPVRGLSLSDAEHLPSWTEPRTDLHRPAAVCCARGYSRRRSPRVPVCLLPAAPRLRHAAASFWLGALSVRALSSTNRRGTKALPPDVCHFRTLPENLHPCSGRPNWLLGSHPHRSEAQFVHANRRCFGRTDERGEGYSPTTTSFALCR